MQKQNQPNLQPKGTKINQLEPYVKPTVSRAGDIHDFKGATGAVSDGSAMSSGS